MQNGKLKEYYNKIITKEVDLVNNNEFLTQIKLHQMKKILTIILIMLVCIIGCVAEGPKPPIMLPFSIHQAGATVSTELRIAEERRYPFSLKFMYNEKDQADRERVRKLVGAYEKDKHGNFIEPGVSTPLKLTISVIDSSGARPLLEKDISALGQEGHGNNFFDRDFDLVRLSPGLYRVTVQSLKDVPELVNTKVIFCIYPRRSGKI